MSGWSKMLGLSGQNSKEKLHHASTYSDQEHEE